MPDKQVCRKSPISKAKLSAAICAGWGRVANEMTKGVFAERIDAEVTTVNRALSGPSLPCAEHLLNSLAADTSALDEVLKLYGLKVTPLRSAPANDMSIAAGMAEGVSEIIKLTADGHRCHRDTLVLATLFRPLIPQLQSIVDDADRMRGVDAA